MMINELNEPFHRTCRTAIKKMCRFKHTLNSLLPDLTLSRWLSSNRNDYIPLKKKKK